MVIDNYVYANTTPDIMNCTRCSSVIWEIMPAVDHQSLSLVIEITLTAL